MSDKKWRVKCMTFRHELLLPLTPFSPVESSVKNAQRDRFLIL